MHHTRPQSYPAIILEFRSILFGTRPTDLPDHELNMPSRKGRSNLQVRAHVWSLHAGTNSRRSPPRPPLAWPSRSANNYPSLSGDRSCVNWFRDWPLSRWPIAFSSTPKAGEARKHRRVLPPVVLCTSGRAAASALSTMDGPTVASSTAPLPAVMDTRQFQPNRSAPLMSWN